MTDLSDVSPGQSRGRRSAGEQLVTFNVVSFNHKIKAAIKSCIVEKCVVK